MPTTKNNKKAQQGKNRSPKAPAKVKKPVNAKISYGDGNTIECALPDKSPARLAKLLAKEFRAPKTAALYFPDGSEYVINWDMTLKKTISKIESAHD